VKAVVVETFGPPADARLQERPTAEPGPGEVRVAVAAVEANYADVLVIEGAYQVKPPLPFTQRVAVQVEYGAYAEEVLVRPEHCYPVPDEVSLEDAAALGLAYQTAWFALTDRAGFRAGESVLALGASGSVGTATIQLAKALGAGTVIGGGRAPEDRDVALEAGADAAVDLSAANLRESLREEVKAVYPEGVDIVVDPVGGAATEAALRALAWRGRLVVVGFAAGQIPTVKTNYLLVKNIAVSGLQWSDYRDRDAPAVARAQAEIFRLAAAGMRPRIDNVMPLADFAMALERLRAGKAQGRIVLTTD
jgi:NADPH2:quinone reductase